MKRNLLAFAFMLLFSLSSYAQEFEKGDKVVNLGVGIGSTLYSGSFYTSSLPPLSASFEMGIADDILDEGSIGVGGYLGFSRYKYEYSGWGWKYSNFILGGRGVFHYPLIDKLDTYTGIMLGFQVVSSKEFGEQVFGWSYNASSGGIVGSWYVGGRYYFNDNFAVMGELGYGVSYLNLGVALKL